MDTQMVSLIDNQDLREEFVKELEAQKSQPAAKHISGRPPTTIAQQNDGIAMTVKKAFLKAWLKLKNTIMPEKRLAQAAHTNQRVLAVIVNEVADPKKGGGTVSLSEVRRM